VVLARKLAERLLDGVGGGVAGDAEDLVVVEEFHGTGEYTAGGHGAGAARPPKVVSAPNGGKIHCNSNGFL
jgi:hypothetical protein